MKVGDKIRATRTYEDGTTIARTGVVAQNYVGECYSAEGNYLGNKTYTIEVLEHAPLHKVGDVIAVSKVNRPESWVLRTFSANGWWINSTGEDATKGANWYENHDWAVKVLYSND